MKNTIKAIVLLMLLNQCYAADRNILVCLQSDDDLIDQFSENATGISLLDIGNSLYDTSDDVMRIRKATLLWIEERIVLSPLATKDYPNTCTKEDGYVAFEYFIKGD